MDQSFGAWLKKFRERLGVTLKDFASVLALKSFASVWQAEQKDERKLRGSTAQAVAYLAGCSTMEELDRMAAAGEFPPLADVARRFNERWAIFRPGVPSPLDLVAGQEAERSRRAAKRPGRKGK